MHNSTAQTVPVEAALDTLNIFVKIDLETPLN